MKNDKNNVINAKINNNKNFVDLIKNKNEDKDDEPNFIKKDEELSEKKTEEVFSQMNNDLKKIVKKLEGVRPEGNQQRNLDRETGGVESEKDKGVSEKDAWDDRGKEIQQMNEDAQDLNNDSKSTRGKSFIHRKKQEVKKMNKKHEESAGVAEAGFAANLKRMRKAKLDKTSAFGPDNESGGRGF